MSCLKSLLRYSLRRGKCNSLLLLTGIFFIVYLTQSQHSVLYYLFTRPNVTDFELQGEKSVTLRKSDKLGAPLEKIVHLDFKGAPPKIDYLLTLIPFLKELGATGILLEYEDMFPYKDEIEDIRALNAYTREDVSAIERAAKKNNLSIIPLIPTLSHLEFVLKLQKYKKFREMDNNPETICPCRKNVYFLLQKMIDQVLEVHKNSKFVHIGCDDTREIGFCPKCKSFMKERRFRRNDLYLEHIRRIASYINTTYEGVRTIVWGNRMAKQKRSSIRFNRIPDLVDIMLSNFKVDYDSFPPPRDMNFYSKAFPKIWIAGAFKGVTGFGQIVTDIDFHLVNFRLWLDFIEQWKPSIDFIGIALIGWQRPSHFDVLCELLPVSLPSLAVNVRSMHDIPDFDYDGIRQSLTCNDFVPLNAKEIMNTEQLSALKCDFPGFEVYRMVHYFFNAMVVVKELLAKLNMEELSFYNVLRGESKPSYLRMLPLGTYRNHLGNLISLENALTAAMLKIYDNYTVSEWIATNVFPVRIHLHAALAVLDNLVEKDVWPRRPMINNLPALNKLFNTVCFQNDTTGCTFIMFPKLK